MSGPACPACERPLPTAVVSGPQQAVVRCEGCGTLLLWSNGRVMRSARSTMMGMPAVPTPTPAAGRGTGTPAGEGKREREAPLPELRPEADDSRATRVSGAPAGRMAGGPPPLSRTPPPPSPRTPPPPSRPGGTAPLARVAQPKEGTPTSGTGAAGTGREPTGSVRTGKAAEPPTPGREPTGSVRTGKAAEPPTPGREPTGSLRTGKAAEPPTPGREPTGSLRTGKAAEPPTPAKTPPAATTARTLPAMGREPTGSVRGGKAEPATGREPTGSVRTGESGKEAGAEPHVLAAVAEVPQMGGGPMVDPSAWFDDTSDVVPPEQVPPLPPPPKTSRSGGPVKDMSAAQPLPLPPLPLDEGVEAEDDEGPRFDEPRTPAMGMRRPAQVTGEATRPGKPGQTGRTQTVAPGPRTPPSSAPAPAKAKAPPPEQTPLHEQPTLLADETPTSPAALGTRPTPSSGQKAVPAGEAARPLLTTPATGRSPTREPSRPIAVTPPSGQTGRATLSPPASGQAPGAPGSRPAAGPPGSRQTVMGSPQPGPGKAADLPATTGAGTPVGTGPPSVTPPTPAASSRSPARMLADLESNAPNALMENAVTTPRVVTPVPATTPLARTTPVSLTAAYAPGSPSLGLGVPEVLPIDTSAPTLPPPPEHDQEAVPRSLRDPDEALTRALLPRGAPSPRMMAYLGGGGALLLAIVLFFIFHRGPATPPPPAGTATATAPPPSTAAPPAATGAATAEPTPSAEPGVAAPPVEPTRPPEPSRPRHTLGGKKVVLEYDPKPTSPAPPPPQAPIPSGEDPRVVARAREAYHRGNVQLFAGDSAGAIERYRESIKIYPGYVAGYRGLGLGYEAAGKTDDALKAFHTYVRTVPSANDVPLIKKRIERLEAAAGSKP